MLEDSQKFEKKKKKIVFNLINAKNGFNIKDIEEYTSVPKSARSKGLQGVQVPMEDMGYFRGYSHFHLGLPKSIERFRRDVVERRSKERRLADRKEPRFDRSQETSDDVKVLIEGVYDNQDGNTKESTGKYLDICFDKFTGP